MSQDWGLAEGKTREAGTDECVGECVCVVGIGQASSSRMQEEMAAHSSVRAWRIPCTEEPGGLQCRGCKEVGTPEATEYPEHIIQKMQEAGKVLHERPL